MEHSFEIWEAQFVNQARLDGESFQAITQRCLGGTVLESL